MPAIAVSGGVESRAQVLGSTVAPADTHVTKVSTDAFRKAAGIVKHDRLNLATARAILRRHARDVILGAFPERSQHATCLKAAQACGVSPDTIDRLIQGGTTSPDVLVLAFCARVCRDRTGKATPICHVLAQVIAVGEWA